jgi:hypothetical protein
MHPEEISIGKIENYDMLVSATEGIYGSLADFMGEIHSFEPNIKGDDINLYDSNYDSYYGGFSSNGPKIIEDFEINWEKLYQTIGSANNVLSQFETSLSLSDDSRKILGEIYMIRAYCYFRLTRTYGQIPLISDIDINYNVKKASYTDIYSFIEKDLKMAMELLPVSNTSARIPFVTPHRGVAKSILAEVYLSWAGYPCNDSQKYTLAAKEAGETIDSADYFGFGLLDDFAYLWDSAHYYNQESEFALFFADPNHSSGWQENNGLYTGMKYFYLNSTEYGFNPNYVDLSFFCAEGKFYNSYPYSYRKEITFYSTIYVPGYVKDYLPKLDTGFITIKQVGGNDRIAYRKFYYHPSIVDRNRYYSYFPPGENFLFYGISRIYLFRYAQTLLTYAEAMARSGQLNSKAFECVNQIRRRANQLEIYSPSAFDLQPGLSPEAFADSVVWERAWELCGEPEGRWFDLVRLEKVEDLPNLRYKKELGPPIHFTRSEYFFPIPAFDTTLNPNLGN